MRFYPDKIYHVYNRGNNSQTIFFTQANYLFFLKKIREYLHADCNVFAYCLMPNHFHLLLQPTEAGCIEMATQSARTDFPIQSLTRRIAILQSSYTRAIQKQEGIKGSLFQQKTKAKALELDERPRKNAVAVCMHYIHQNPLKAGLTHRLEDWQYSSFLDYAGLRNGTLCRKEVAISLAELNLSSFVKDSYAVIKEEVIEKTFY